MGRQYGDLAKEAAIALGQAPAGLALSRLAEVLDARPSSVQRALDALATERMVESSGEGRVRRRVLSGSPAARAFLDYALLTLPADVSLRIVCRANQGVEFAGHDAEGLVIVLSPFAEPAEVVRLRSALATLGLGKGAAMEMVGRFDLRRRLLDDRRLLARGRRGLRVIKGSPTRTFRDPHRRGPIGARPLGDLHPSLNRPSQRRLRELAARAGLRRLSLFGSAVREDLRPDSDVDVLVEPRPGEPLSMARLMDVQRELEDVFGRDVDVVTVGSLPADVRARAEQSAVKLHG